MHLRGLAYRLAKNYFAAIAAITKSIELDCKLNHESTDVAIGLNSLAVTQRLAGEFCDAELNFTKALGVAKSISDEISVGHILGNWSDLESDRKDWSAAEKLAQDALVIARRERIKAAIGMNCRRIGQILHQQMRNESALVYAEEAVKICGELHLKRESALAIECLEICRSGHSKTV